MFNLELSHQEMRRWVVMGERLQLGLLGMRLLDCEEQERAIANWGFWGSSNVFFIIRATSSIAMCKIKQQYQHLLIMNVDLKS
jgi:hypothetical protein